MFKFIMPKFIFKIEKWKWNKEYRLYVSTLGHIMDEHKNPKPILINSNGYITVKTCNGFVLLHRLVMKTWKPTEDMDNLTVDHLDHNKRNNALDNLEWVSRTENQRRAAEDFIPTIEKKEGQKQKQSPDIVQEKNPKLRRYNRTDFAFDDLRFRINSKTYETIAEAYAAGAEILSAKKDMKKIAENGQYNIGALTMRYHTLLNACNTKDKKVIDGERTTKYFKYLNLSVIVKEQEDE